MADQWQISFDHGHQQRYLPDRRAVLSYVLSIGPRAASPRFDVFVEHEPGPTADGRPSRPVVLRRSGSSTSAAPAKSSGSARSWRSWTGRARRETRRERAQRAAHAGPGRQDHPLNAGSGPPVRRAARGTPRRRCMQVVSHLVIENVPADQRSPLFDQAAELLDEAGWGVLDELYAAASRRARAPAPCSGRWDLET